MEHHAISGLQGLLPLALLHGLCGLTGLFFISCIHQIQMIIMQSQLKSHRDEVHNDAAGAAATDDSSLLWLPPA